MKRLTAFLISLAVLSIYLSLVAVACQVPYDPGFC
jgi:hypothetical protein